MLRINSKNIENCDDTDLFTDLEMHGVNNIIEYHKEQISKSINEYLFKQFTDLCAQNDIRYKKLSLTDSIEFDRYVIPSYFSIDYKDKNAPLIPIVL